MTAQSTTNSTSPFMICGWVFYENRSGCIDPEVNITNLNRSIQWTAQKHPEHYYYQLVLNTTDAANISEGCVLQINARNDGVLINSIEHVITSKEISNGTAMVDLNEGSIDLEVSGILRPTGFYTGKNKTVEAFVENRGTAYTNLTFRTSQNWFNRI